jgi:dTDP-4-dehydrorhamnose 3,5-epimerase
MENLLEIKNPITQQGPLTQAYQYAVKNREPVFVPVMVHADDRGWSIMNQFQNVLNEAGQINYSVVYPYAIKAWHRHDKQTDMWLCLHGHIKVGIHREEDDTFWSSVMGEKRPGVMIIPPPLWHGMSTVGDEQAGLLYYVTRQYNANEPDEIRRPFDAVADFPWGIEHR